MSDIESMGVPKGAVPLGAAIVALRDELIRAWWDGQNKALRFAPAPVELTLQLTVTSAGKASAGAKWWLISAGGEVSRESVVTQTVKVALEPRMFDEGGQPLEFLIDAEDAAASDVDTGEVPLDTTS